MTVKYTIQFDCKTEQDKNVAAFLESLERKKAPVIFQAVSEWMKNHPDLVALGGSGIKLSHTSNPIADRTGTDKSGFDVDVI